MTEKDAFLEQVRDDKGQIERYTWLKSTLEPLAQYFRGKHVLDFGSSYGLSTCALLEHGAARVTGVEPDPKRVERGRHVLEATGWSRAATVQHVADTRRLPFPDASFDVVLANAVFEHIPQPRHEYLREVWRLLKPGGLLIINETPNKYLPKDIHTTGLWFLNWLPREVARRYAMLMGRYPKDESWEYSGWRGAGFWELAASLPGYELIHETSRPRHRLLRRLGLPASLLDPYPTWLFRKKQQV